MPAHPMQIDTGAAEALPAMEGRAARIDMPHHFDHRFDVKRLTENSCGTCSGLSHQAISRS